MVIIASSSSHDTVKTDEVRPSPGAVSLSTVARAMVDLSRGDFLLKNVLIVEDDFSIADLLQAALEAMGIA